MPKEEWKKSANIETYEYLKEVIEQCEGFLEEVERSMKEKRN